MAGHFCDLSELQQLAKVLSAQAARARRPPPEYVGKEVIYRHPERALETPWTPGSSWEEALRSLARQGQGNEQAAAGLGRLLDQVLRGGGGRLLLSPDDAWVVPEVRAVLEEAGKHQSPQELRGRLAAALEEVGLSFRAMAVRFPLLNRVVTLLGHQDRPVKLRDRSVNLRIDGAFSLSEEDAQLLQLVASGSLPYPRLKELVQNPAKARADAIDRLLKFIDIVRPYVDQVLGPGSHFTVADFYGRVLPALDEATRQRLLSEIRPLAVVTEDLQVLTRQEFERALDEDLDELLATMKKQYGPFVAFLLDLVSRVRDFSREVGVFRPLFWLEQFIQDSVVKPWLAGIRGWTGATYKEYRAYTQTWRKALELGISPETIREAGLVPRTAADRTLEEWGVTTVPLELSSAFERAFQNRELIGYSSKESAVWRLPGLRFFWNAYWGNQKRAVDSFLRLVGLPARAYSEAAALVSLLARSQEMATRKAVFAAGVEQAMTQGLAEGFLREVEQVFAAHGASDLFPQFAERFRNATRRLPQDLSRFVLNLAPDRPTLATQVARFWSQVAEEAVRRGLELTRRINYDFLDRRRGDELLGAIFRYHFWASRNLPFYLEEMLRHYTLFRFWVRSLLTSERSAEEEGTPNRARPRIPVPLGPLDDLLFGREARFYLDAWALVSVTSQIDPSSLWLGERYGTLYDQARSLAASVGFSVNWDLAMILALLGYDTRPSFPRLIPQTWMLGGTLGIEPFGFLGEPLYRLRGRISGELPFSEKVPYHETLTGNRSLDRAVWLTILAMAFRDTGNPNHPRYIMALANPDDPIFQEAYREATKTRLAEAVFNYLTPGFRGALVLPEEETMRRRGEERAALLAALPGWARQELIKIGDVALWYLYMPGDAREAQIRSGFAAERLGITAPLFYVQRLPWFLSYRLWARQQEPGQRSLDAFFAAVEEGKAATPEELAVSGYFDQFLLARSGWRPVTIFELAGKLEDRNITGPSLDTLR